MSETFETGLLLQAAPLPPNFEGNPQQLIDAFLDRVKILSPFGLGFFVSGSNKPTSNQGPWLKDGTKWYVWSDDDADYIPLDISDSATAPYTISPDYPTTSNPPLWIKVSSGYNAVVGIYLYLGTPYTDISLLSGAALTAAQAAWTPPSMGGDLTGSFPNPLVADNAITTSKLAKSSSDDSIRPVVTDTIRNKNVTTEKLADGAVTAEKLAAGVLANGVLQVKAVTIPSTVKVGNSIESGTSTPDPSKGHAIATVKITPSKASSLLRMRATASYNAGRAFFLITVDGESKCAVIDDPDNGQGIISIEYYMLAGSTAERTIVLRVSGDPGGDITLSHKFGSAGVSFFTVEELNGTLA